jgi:cystathionine beta-lyase family protein involved in aluminum resistance
MYTELGITEEVVNLIKDSEAECQEVFKKIDEVCDYNSLKVLTSFNKNEISEACFNETTGYGYNDLGREKIEQVFKDVLGSEDALVRGQFISGSHALTVCLFALLRPNDLLLSITGKPYDTLDEVIGLKENNSSLKSYGIKYDQIDLVNNDFDYEIIENYLRNNKVKVIEIQRSKGYSTRKSLDIKKVEKVIKLIKEIDSNIIVMVDNCYCEFVGTKEPTEVGADVIVGSLINTSWRRS